MTTPNKVAAIDMGTNSFHMVIASIDEHGLVKIINKEKELVRLGSSGDDMKMITPEAEKRALDALVNLKKIADSDSAEIIATATSATREAKNKKSFIKKIKELTDIDVKIISGVEEARLIFQGMNRALPVYDQNVLLIDIGGGSTETVVGKRNKIKLARSIKLGSVRLTKKFFDKKNVRIEDIEKCKKYIGVEWSTILDKVKSKNFEKVVCTSGTLENLLIMTHIQKHKSNPLKTNGLTVQAKDLLKLINKIKDNRDPEKLKEIQGLDPARADIILAGALIVENFITKLGLKELTLSDYALREGVIYNHFDQVDLLETNKHLSNLRLNTVMGLLKKYDCDLKHSLHIQKLSIQIFEQLQKVHKLDLHAEEWLEAASLLHDCGFFISHSSHHKHSYYLILNSEMPGFTNDEAEIIANIARYHRKSLPKNSHPNFTNLSDRKKKIIWILGGILRIVEGIDRRQNSLVKELKVDIQTKEIHISLIKNDVNIEPDIELMSADRRKDMLEKALDRKISFSIV